MKASRLYRRNFFEGMDLFFKLTKRHFLVFFKNKIRVFYTMIVPCVLLAVYIVFLRSLEITTVKNILLENGVSLAEDDPIYKMIEAVVDSWMLSGILILSTITVSIQTNNIIVNDKENGVNRDFMSSPISNKFLIGSYFVFNFIVTLMICLVVLIICLIYLGVMGEFYLDFTDIISILGVLILSTVTSTLLTIFVCSFIKREATLSSLIAISSAVAGFLIGAYMPLSMFPTWLGNVCCFIPGTYSVGLMRFAFMDTGIQQLTEMMENSALISNGSALIEELTQNFGYGLVCFDVNIEIQYQGLINIVAVLVLLVLNIITARYLTKVISSS